MKTSTGILLVFCLLLGNFRLQGQNLVANPGFETTLGTPSTAGQWNLAAPWLGLSGSPDLYVLGGPSAPPSPCDDVDIPFNAGGYCPERNAQAHYMGLQQGITSSTREYISVPLSAPLTANSVYRLQFYVQLADSSRYSCNRLGMLLTNNIPVQPAGGGVISFIPQLEATAQITDTANWVLVSGAYLAIGGENYATIGIFRADGDPLLTRTDRGNQNPGCTGLSNSAYYYIDDVSVVPVDQSVTIEGDTIICPGQSTVLTANTNLPFWWSDAANPSDTLSLLLNLTVTPATPTVYYLNTDFGTDSVLVDIVPPPVFELGPDTLLCEGDTILLDATAPDGLLYQWSTGDTTAVIAITDTGSYTVTVDNSGCSRTDSIRLPGFLSNPVLSLGEDSLYCFFYEDTLILDAGDGLDYLWTPTNEITREIKILTPGIYTVAVTRNNGCRRYASLEVDEVCEPNIFIPSAFSPDDDGINDIFKPIVRNVELYNFRVLNRRGQTVFYSEDTTAGWDGVFEGTQAPIGVYVYRLNYQGLDKDGIKLKKKIIGTVTLLR